MATYYTDTNDFSTATSIWTNSNLTIKAEDGFYQKDGLYREMSGGELLPSTICPACPPPSCPDRRVVFQICNSNSAKDDNFAINVIFLEFMRNKKLNKIGYFACHFSFPLKWPLYSILFRCDYSNGQDTFATWNSLISTVTCFKILLFISHTNCILCWAL